MLSVESSEQQEEDPKTKKNFGERPAPGDAIDSETAYVMYWVEEEILALFMAAITKE